MKLYPAAIALFAAYVRAADNDDDNDDKDGVSPQPKTAATPATNGNGQFAVPPSTTITFTRDGAVFTSYAWWLPEASGAFGNDKPVDYATTTDSNGRTTISPVWWKPSTESAKPSKTGSVSVATGDVESSTKGASRASRKTSSDSESSDASAASTKSGTTTRSSSASSGSSSSASEISTTTNGAAGPLRALPAGYVPQYSAGPLASAFGAIIAAAVLL
ncbi:AaceriAAR076Cp [[Ashbya] aceris (nom. inval.)]|nr:AaceriAAR076Cp [[Ashbya] aceris (nom. inval.)]